MNVKTRIPKRLNMAPATSRVPPQRRFMMNSRSAFCVISICLCLSASVKFSFLSGAKRLKVSYYTFHHERALAKYQRPLTQLHTMTWYAIPWETSFCTIILQFLAWLLEVSLNPLISLFQGRILGYLCRLFHDYNNILDIMLSISLEITVYGTHSAHTYYSNAS